METILKERVNVAPSSDEGHFIEESQRVVQLDDVTESFFVEGKSKLVTKNHTTLEIEDDCLINCQMVYNPFAKMYERSRD